MNALLLNRDGFQMPADGWYQVAPLGEFAHAAAGVVQVVDAEACVTMAGRFAEEAKGENFAGLLVDFDHFSLDGEKRSEAAGWIVDLAVRVLGSGETVVSLQENPPRPAATPPPEGICPACGHPPRSAATPPVEGMVANTGAGLFAKIRWSDVGEEAVKGGRYRFLSPVWSRADCVDLGNGRVRPVRLLNAAVTNDPNLKGMRPLSNRGQGENIQQPTANPSASSGHECSQHPNEIANAGGEARFKWVLGETAEGEHCPSCTAAAGQVHTMAEWDAAGVTPGAGGLYCQEKCRCRLVATPDAAGGALGGVPLRREEAVENSRTVERSGGGTEQVSTAKDAKGREGEALANVGWTESARVASLEVRRAKALLRGSRNDQTQTRQEESMDKATVDYEEIYKKKGHSGMTPEEKKYLAARIGVKVRNGTKLTDAEERFVREHGLSPAAAARNREQRSEARVQRETARGALAAVRLAKGLLRAEGGYCVMANPLLARHKSLQADS